MITKINNKIHIKEKKMDSESLASKSSTKIINRFSQVLNTLPNAINPVNHELYKEVDGTLPILADRVITPFSDKELKSLKKAEAVIDWQKTHPDTPSNGATRFGQAYFEDHDVECIEKAKRNQIQLDFNQWLYGNYWKHDNPALRSYILKFFPSLLDNQMEYLKVIQEKQKYHVKTYLLGDVKTPNDLIYNYMVENGLVNDTDLGFDQPIHKGFEIGSTQNTRNIKNAVIGRENRNFGGIAEVNGDLARPLAVTRAGKATQEINGEAITKGRQFLVFSTGGGAAGTAIDKDITTSATSKTLISKNMQF